jgi:hypothetical protein
MNRSSTAQHKLRQLVSPGNRPITFFRRLTSSSERSSRFVSGMKGDSACCRPQAETWSVWCDHSGQGRWEHVGSGRPIRSMS